MTRQDLSSESTTMYAEGDELVAERVFDAPRELVWAVMTSPEHVSAWWGPYGTTTDVVEMDVRPGGTWRWVNRYDGGEAPFRGEYLEVEAPERYVRTSIYDVVPANEGPPAIEELVLTDLGGRTRVVHRSRFPSPEVLAMALGTGMSKGALETYDRLADVLAEAG